MLTNEHRKVGIYLQNKSHMFKSIVNPLGNGHWDLNMRGMIIIWFMLEDLEFSPLPCYKMEVF